MTQTEVMKGIIITTFILFYKQHYTEKDKFTTFYLKCLEFVPVHQQLVQFPNCYWLSIIQG